MVKSINPHHRDSRYELGRRLTNEEVGMLMLAKLAESIERYKPQGHRNRPLDAVEELLRVAKQKARATGRSVSDVLREHRNALEDGGQDSRFILSTSNTRRAPTDNAAMHAAQALQDERRATEQPGTMLAAAGAAVDARDSQTQVVPYARAELAPPAHVATSTSVARRPAPRHAAGGDNPNADHLRLMAPPVPRHEDSRPLRLMHNPTGGGGQHNAIDLGDDDPAPPPQPAPTQPASSSGAGPSRPMRARAPVDYHEAEVSNEGGDTFGASTKKRGKQKATS